MTEDRSHTRHDAEPVAKQEPRTAVGRACQAVFVAAWVAIGLPDARAQWQGSPQALGNAAAPLLQATPSAPRVAPVTSSSEPGGSIRNDIDMADYLQALAQLNPAAADGALAFMRAFQARCGRPLRILELRRAVADKAGDPVLMQMIRAAYEHDATASRGLADQVNCSLYGGVARKGQK